MVWYDIATMNVCWKCMAHLEESNAVDWVFFKSWKVESVENNNL